MDTSSPGAGSGGAGGSDGGGGSGVVQPGPHTDQGLDKDMSGYSDPSGGGDGYQSSDGTRGDGAQGSREEAEGSNLESAQGSSSGSGANWRNRCTAACSINRKMLGYKVFFFAFLGGLGSVLPYVSVFLKQRGLSPEQIGLVSGLRPVIGFISAPVLGNLGDKFGIRKCLFLVSIIAWLAFYVGLFFIPEPARSHECPADFQNQRGGHHPDSGKRASGGDDVTATLDSTTVASGKHNASWESRQDALKEDIGWVFLPGPLQTVFILALVIIVGGEVVQAPTTAFADAGTLQTLGKAALDDYGAQRAWGGIGFGVASLLAGGIVSSSRTPTTICGVELYFSDYRMLAYVFIGFLVTAFISATQINFKEGTDEETIELTGAPDTPGESDEKKPKEIHNTMAVIRIFFNVHYGSWLTTSFFVGICNGVIWGFLFWHLENLGADQLLMGIASIVTCISEFVMFFLVGKTIRVFGHMGIMYMGLLGYAIRFCVYALLTNPWWVLPAEVLQGITFSSVWVSMTAYTTLAVPSVSLATIQGILHGVYFGLGNGTGHLIGGLMIGYFGAVTTFYVFSVSCVVAFILFIIAQKCSTKPELDLAQFHYKDIDADATTDR